MTTSSEASGAKLQGLESQLEDKPEGPISAAIIAGGVGALVLGVLTTLAEMNETIKGWLELKKSVGPLGGKTIFAVVGWLIAWGILHSMMKGTRYETKRAFTVAMVLVALGVIGTFPTFFKLFAE